MPDETNGTTNAATPEPPSKRYTPPKGRPTRSRGDTGQRQRAFGPVAQWITFVIAVILVVVVIIMVTGGGDFNPLNDDDTVGAPAATSATG